MLKAVRFLLSLSVTAKHKGSQRSEKSSFERVIESAARKVTAWTGSTSAFALKLNEVVAAMKGASNRLIDVEDLSEPELRALHTHYETWARMAKRDIDLLSSHSVEEAKHRHHRKVAAEKADERPAAGAQPGSPI